MCNTLTTDIDNTIKQINDLQAAGCEIVRLAIPDIESAKAIKTIKSLTDMPLVADIHFDHNLAIEAIKNGINALRINPGNIGSHKKVKEVVDYAKEHNSPIRIGVNSGSIAKHILAKYGVSAEAVVGSALEHVRILEDENFFHTKISVKTSSVPMTIKAYKLLAEKVSYPLHVGVTEAGTEFMGTIKSSIGIGSLLADGIGDTIRVSLTDEPVKEIAVAKGILKALGIRKGLEIISCPTCGRTQIPLLELTREVEDRLKPYEHLDISVAVMGCEVNGPGEAREADFGIAGGKNEGLIFKKGEVLCKLPSDKLVDHLVDLIIPIQVGGARGG
jgi:(E)-4-hydroxy-3-methylbut-2-enyl-diphosphate synthase